MIERMELGFIERVYQAEELFGQLTIHGWCSLPLAYWEQRGRCGAVERRFARRHQEVQQPTRLLPAGGYHGQQPSARLLATTAAPPTRGAPTSCGQHCVHCEESGRP